MDLPTCPACGQSVLDDDVDDCPFCGASLSGKPSASKPPAPQTTAAPSAPGQSKSGAAPSPGKRAPAESQPETKPQEDDPFATEGRATPAKVVRLKPNPEPGRRHPVVCPMCETTGYTATKAAGRDVRCVNPECRLPIFKSPPIEDEEDDEDAGKRDLMTPAKITITASVVVVIAFVAWFFGIRTGSRDDDSTSGVNPPGVVDRNKTKTTPDDEDPPEAKADPLDALRKRRAAALRRSELAASADNSHVTKPLAQQRALRGYLHVGDIESAKRQLSAIRSGTTATPYYQVVPRALLAWHLLADDAEDSKSEATSHIEVARQAAGSLPSGGRLRCDAASTLAAVLFVTGRRKEADETVGRYNDPGLTGRLSLMLTAGREFGAYDLDEMNQNMPVLAPQSPQRVAVTIILAAHNRPEQSLAWSRMQSDARDRNECLAIWAELRAAHPSPEKPGKKDEQALPAWQTVADELPPAYRAATYARAAAVQPNGSQAGETLEAARTQAAALKLPTVDPIDEVSEVLSKAALGPRERLERESTAAAFAELARAEFIVGGKSADAAKRSWDALARALEFSRPLAPSPVAVAAFEKTSQAEFAGASGGNDAARIAREFREFRSRVQTLKQPAKARMAFEENILERALGWGSPRLAELIWAEVASRSSADVGLQREPWLATSIPLLLVRRLAASSDSSHQQLAKEIGEATKKSREPVGDRPIVQRTALAALDEGNFDQAVRALYNADANIEAAWRDLFLLTTACRYVGERKLDSAYKLIRAVDDPEIRVDAFDLVGALGAKMGMHEEVWKLSQDRSFKEADRAAIYHGLAVGLQIPKQQPGESTAESSGAGE